MVSPIADFGCCHGQDEHAEDLTGQVAQGELSVCGTKLMLTASRISSPIP